MKDIKDALIELERIIVEDRPGQHGSYTDNDRIVVDLWNSFLRARGGVLKHGDYSRMMILMKLGRMLSAGSHSDDHAKDIAGYAMLLLTLSD